MGHTQMHAAESDTTNTCPGGVDGVALAPFAAQALWAGGPCLFQGSVPCLKCDLRVNWGWGAREALCFLGGAEASGGARVWGVSACVREVTLKSHCQPGLLATEDHIQPLWWPQPQSVTTWKTKHSQKRKCTLAAAAHMSWPWDD